MSEPPTTTFVHRIETDAGLLAALERMYQEAMADDPTAGAITHWRPRLRLLLHRYGRDVVIESLMESVEGLSLRHAVILADLADRHPSGRAPAIPV